MRKYLFIGQIILFTFLYKNIYSQCRISHLNGSSTYNGINVTVSTSGSVDTLSYCNNKLGPYWPGVHSPPPFSCKTGSYSFTFSPPVNEVYLNFGGINSQIGNSEIIRVYINGAHFPLTTIGDSLTCQQMAILTPDGDIASPNWDIAGWEGTKITGTINTITIEDSVLIGCGNGAVFSISLCNWAVGTSDIDNEENKIKVYPNPSNGDLNIHVSKTLINGSLRILNLTGVTILQQERLNGNIFSFDISRELDGIYFIEIKTDKGRETIKFVKH